MKRIVLVSYATIAYLWFAADIAWAVTFLADVPVLTGIDHGRQGPVLAAVAVDLGLLGLFAVHHSVMARDRAKRVITALIPAAAERSTYVLVADGLLALVFWQWRPIDATLWDVQGHPWRSMLWCGYGLGWVVALSSTFMIDHLEFLGVRQAASAPGRYRPGTFRERWLYRWVRHPLMLGLLMALWLTPRMSAGHVLFAAASTADIAVGIRFEERDLRRRYGPAYTDYVDRVGAVIPRPTRERRCPATRSATS